jgi:hypothetical protein
MQNHQQILRLLLEWGRASGIEKTYPRTWPAVMSRDLDGVITEFMRERLKVDKEGRTSRSSLQFAASRGDFDTVVQLLDAGADINLRASFGNALHAAVSQGHLEVARELLRRGATTEAPRLRNWGARPKVIAKGTLEVAVKKSNTSIIKLLLENGNDVNLDIGNGHTVLENCKDGTIRQLLLEQGALTWAELHPRSVHVNPDVLTENPDTDPEANQTSQVGFLEPVESSQEGGMNLDEILVSNTFVTS